MKRDFGFTATRYRGMAKNLKHLQMLFAPANWLMRRQIRYLAAALKAPRIVETAARLADQARDASWSFEDYLAAVLDRGVIARNASGAQLRIRPNARTCRYRPTQRRTVVVDT